MTRIKKGLKKFKAIMIGTNKCYHRFKMEDLFEMDDPKCMHCKLPKSQIIIQEKL